MKNNYSETSSVSLPRWSWSLFVFFGAIRAWCMSFILTVESSLNTRTRTCFYAIRTRAIRIPTDVIFCHWFPRSVVMLIKMRHGTPVYVESTPLREFVCHEFLWTVWNLAAFKCADFILSPILLCKSPPTLISLYSEFDATGPIILLNFLYFFLNL